MSWIKMTMRFPGKCINCKKPIKIGEKGLWLKGRGVKHEECGVSDGIHCIICGKPAGCDSCEMADDCDIKKVSSLCVCTLCDRKYSVEDYYKSVAQKFPMLLDKRRQKN